MTAIGSTSYYRNSVYSPNAARSSASGASGPVSALSIDKQADRSQSSIDSRPSAASVNFHARLLSSVLTPTDIATLPEDIYREFVERQKDVVEAMRRGLEHQYANMAGVPPSSATLPYASVTVGGEVIATVDNQGVVSYSNAIGAKFRDVLLGDLNGTNGPDLAQARAEQIAELLGGRIVKSDMALSQSAFNALPPPDSYQPPVNYEAMRNDPLYDQLQRLSQHLEDIKQRREAYLESLGE